MLGPPLVPIWIAGLVALWRDRSLRFLAVAFPVLLVLVFVMGSQFYYPFGLLAVLFAAGCVPAWRWVSARTVWRRLLVIGVVVNAVVSALLALPLVPLGSLSDTPIAAISQVAQDTVGWPRYVAQVAAVYRRLAGRRTRAHRRLRQQLRRGRRGRPLRSRRRAARGLQRTQPALRRGAPARLDHDGRVRRRSVRRHAADGSVRARSRRISTTASASTTRSRANRSPCVAGRRRRGRSCGRGCITSTEGGQCPAMSSMPTSCVGVQPHQ